MAGIVLIGAVRTTFAVPNDPRPSGNAPAPVQGALRPTQEIAIICRGTRAFHASGLTWTGIAIAVLALVHYVPFSDRIVRLLRDWGVSKAKGVSNDATGSVRWLVDRSDGLPTRLPPDGERHMRAMPLGFR